MPGAEPPPPTAPVAEKPRVLTIFLTRTVLNASFRVVYPFLPSIARGLGIPLAAATGLVTLRMVVGLSAPLLGPLTDRYSRRRVMEIGLLLFTLASLLLAGVGTFAAAAVAFALYGIAKILYDPAVYAYIGDTVPYRQRGRVLGMIEFSWSGAWLLSVPIFGLVIEWLGWRAPWGILVVLGLAGLWLTHTRIPDAPPPAPAGRAALLPSILATWRSLLGRRAVVAILLVSALFTLANEVTLIVYGAWLESSFELSLSALGLASIVLGVAEATAELGATALIDRLGKRRSVLFGLLGLAASLAALPWLSGGGLAPALGGMALMVLAFEFTVVSILPILTEVAPATRASMLSLNLTAFSLARIAGSVLGAWLWRWEDIALHAGLGAVCALAAALLLVWGVTTAEGEGVTSRSRDTGSRP